MLVSAIFRRCLALVGELDLAPPCRRDLVAVLEAHRGAWINAWHEAGLDAGLDREELLARGVALYFLSATINLCDDLMDGDATYVRQSDGPLAQILAHTAFVHALARTTVSAAAVQRATLLLFEVGSAQHPEADRPPWDEARYRELARAQGGQQSAAYLRLLWDGTPLEPEAETTGAALGIAGFVRADVDDRDDRLLARPPAAAAALLAFGRAAAAQAAAGTASAAIREMARQCERALAAAALPASAPRPAG
jgi:hypothetical protein